MGIISFNKEIFICGGYNGESLNSVQKYSIKTDTWELVSPMNISRYGIAVVALGKYLYAIGKGRNGLNEVNIVINFIIFRFCLSYLELQLKKRLYSPHR